MTGRPRAWVSWSSGKDSALALHETIAASDVDVCGLLTTVNFTADRVAMHAVRRTLLMEQGAQLGLPVHVVELPWPCGNDVYEQRMVAALQTASAEGISQIVFGDLFLEDVRAYRIAAMAGSGITPVFPLWGRETRQLAHAVVERGIRAVVTCVDPRQIPAELCGRWYDESFLQSLPAGADPCGENGEFHTFVAASPDFRTSIDISVGEIVERDGFVFADLVPC
ncbi:MAG: hypothetical protein QOJ79_1881 [Actinomycetota bacterium]|nr:hypothetical protein [Actinomycetota bacterium]